MIFLVFAKRAIYDTSFFSINSLSFLITYNNDLTNFAIM